MINNSIAQPGVKSSVDNAAQTLARLKAHCEEYGFDFGRLLALLPSITIIKTDRHGRQCGDTWINVYVVNVGGHRIQLVPERYSVGDLTAPRPSPGILAYTVEAFAAWVAFTQRDFVKKLR